jgi:hypothetical protein
VPSIAHPEHAESATRSRSRPARTAKWLGGSVLLALAGWSAVGLADYAVGRFSEDVPSPPVQLAERVGQAAASGLHVVENRTVDFKGTGDDARVLVLRSDRGGSDELQVLDLRGERLVRALRFRPTVAGARASVRIRIVDVADLDDNGSQEMVAALSLPALDSTRDGPHVVRHVVVAVWDWLHGEYALVPLLGARASKGAPLRVARVDAVVRKERRRREAYTTPISIGDANGGKAFVSHGVEGFRVRKTAAGAYLDAWFLVQRASGFGVGGGVAVDPSGKVIVGKPRFVTDRPGYAHVRVWRIRPWRLDAPLYACDGAGTIVTLRVQDDVDAAARRAVGGVDFCA